MSISGVTGAERVVPMAADTSAPETSTRASAPAVIDPSAAVSAMVSQRSTPPRFPWLSRLSAQLEPMAPQRHAFSSAPPLGENLDQAA